MRGAELGFIPHLDATDRHEGHDMTEEFWDEHAWALTGRQTGVIVAAILVVSTLLSLG